MSGYRKAHLTRSFYTCVVLAILSHHGTSPPDAFLSSEQTESKIDSAFRERSSYLSLQPTKTSVKPGLHCVQGHPGNLRYLIQLAIRPKTQSDHRPLLFVQLEKQTCQLMGQFGPAENFNGSRPLIYQIKRVSSIL